jgi:hypothetical protein
MHTIPILQLKEANFDTQHTHSTDGAENSYFFRGICDFLNSSEFSIITYNIYI